MAIAPRDANYVPIMMGVSSADGITPVAPYVDPVTHRMLVSAVGGGTVSTVSVVTNQGVSGNVANPTTTPAITLTLGALTGVTSYNGLVITADTGVITSGTWNGTVIIGTYGGTGSNNGTKTFIYLKNMSFTAADDTGVYTLPTGTKTIASLSTTLDQFGAPAADVAWNSKKITGLATPTNSGDAATKGYVDGVASGLSIKQSVQVATITVLPTTIVYLNGASGVGATITGGGVGTLTIDGYTVLLNDRVLVQNQADPTENGIYLCTTQGAGGVIYVLTRATDSDTSAKLIGGFVFVINGTVNADSGFVNTNTSAITIGHGGTNITYTQFSGAGEITANNGVTKSGNTISIENSGVLTVAHGGTGVATLAANGVLYGNTTGVVQVTAQGGANTILTANSGAPVFSGTPIINTSVQIGVASGTTGSLKLAHASSANLTTIQGGNAANARTYIWPTDFGAAGTVLTDAGGNGTLSWAAGGGGTPYRAQFSTNFETTGRFAKTLISTGTVTFTSNGANLSSGATGTASADMQWDPLGLVSGSDKGRLFAGNPMFSAWVGGLVPCTGTADSAYVGVGAVTVTGSNITYTPNHFGFKFVDNGSNFQLFATQAAGTTETASSALVTVTSNDCFELIAIYISASEIDYYYRQNGGTLSGKTSLTTNVPAAASACDVIDMAVTNHTTAAACKMTMAGITYSRDAF